MSVDVRRYDLMYAERFPREGASGHGRAWLVYAASDAHPGSVELIATFYVVSTVEDAMQRALAYVRDVQARQRALG